MYTRQLGLSRIPRALYVLTLTFCLAISTLVHAQVAGTGSVQGEVVDSSGAKIPAAVVTLTEEATRVVRTATTDKAGSFVFPNITPGTYTVSITAPGFKTFSK